MYSKKNAVPVVEKNVATNVEVTSMKKFETEVVRNVGGEQKLEYSINIPETSSTSVEMDNALVRVVDGATPYVTVYASYEGGRKYTPEKYLNEVIAPRVSVINSLGEVMIGNTMWYKGESEWSQWHIASVADGKWLVIVENKKVKSPLVEQTLTSFAVK